LSPELVFIYTFLDFGKLQNSRWLEEIGLNKIARPVGKYITTSKEDSS